MKAKFIEPMLLLRTEKLPDSPDLVYEIKLDGYRAVALKRGGKVHLRSRNDNDFGARYPAIAKALQGMPDESVIDGVVAIDPGFKSLVAKNRKSRYEPGQRSGAWQKMRVNQELVIGGYTPSLKNFDALVIGYYVKGRLMYAAQTRC